MTSRTIYQPEEPSDELLADCSGTSGGMMGSLMADLETNLESINKYKAKRNLPFMTQDELLIKLFNEVAYVWPRVGYPPLVTLFSQYVKNLADDERNGHGKG